MPLGAGGATSGASTRWQLTTFPAEIYATHAASGSPLQLLHLQLGAIKKFAYMRINLEAGEQKEEEESEEEEPEEENEE